MVPVNPMQVQRMAELVALNGHLKGWNGIAEGDSGRIRRDLRHLDRFLEAADG